MQRNLKAAQTAAAQQKPLTESSQGWILRGRSDPSTGGLGSEDVWIYAKSGKLYAKSAGGSPVPLDPIPTFPKGASVSAPPAMTAFTAPASYNVLHSQSLRDDIAALRTKVIQLITSLENAGLLLTP